MADADHFMLGQRRAGKRLGECGESIVENKRLGHALALVKAQQDMKLATRVITNSEKGDCRKRPRKIHEQQMAIEAAIEMPAS